MTESAEQKGPRKTSEAGACPPKRDPLSPALGLLVKLGSIAVHAEEIVGSTRHPFDAANLAARRCAEIAELNNSYWIAKDIRKDFGL